MRRSTDFAVPVRPVSSSGISAPRAGNFPHDISLRYTETSRIIVEGSATRRQYEFSASDPVKPVDSRDAAALLNTRFFVRA